MSEKKIAVLPIKSFIDIMNSYVDFLERDLIEGLYKKEQIIQMFRNHFFDIEFTIDQILKGDKK